MQEYERGRVSYSLHESVTAVCGVVCTNYICKGRYTIVLLSMYVDTTLLTFVVYDLVLLLLSWGSRKYENSDILKVAWANSSSIR